MLKKFLLIIFSTLIITSCSNNIEINNTNDILESEIDNSMEIVTNINITMNGKDYNVTLENNQTAQEFAKILPQELSMNELNNNEKYYYMDISLPTNPTNPKQIKAGDIMLYGDNCIVIFYKSFTTSYSYTKIGHIDNMPSLDNNNITVKFNK